VENVVEARMVKNLIRGSPLFHFMLFLVLELLE
jgi:hypothetical protein